MARKSAHLAPTTAVPALSLLALAFGAGAVSIFLLPETCGTELV